MENFFTPNFIYRSRGSRVIYYFCKQILTNPNNVTKLLNFFDQELIHVTPAYDIDYHRLLDAFSSLQVNFLNHSISIGEITKKNYNFPEIGERNSKSHTKCT